MSGNFSPHCKSHNHSIEQVLIQVKNLNVGKKKWKLEKIRVLYWETNRNLPGGAQYEHEAQRNANGNAGNLLSAHLCSLCLSWAEILRESVKFSAHKSGLLLAWAENFRNKLLLSSLSSAQERRFALTWAEKISKQGVIICPWGFLHQFGQTGIEHAPWNVFTLNNSSMAGSWTERKIEIDRALWARNCWIKLVTA